MATYEGAEIQGKVFEDRIYFDLTPYLVQFVDKLKRDGVITPDNIPIRIVESDTLFKLESYSLKSIWGVRKESKFFESVHILKTFLELIEIAFNKKQILYVYKIGFSDYVTEPTGFVYDVHGVVKCYDSGEYFDEELYSLKNMREFAMNVYNRY